MDPVTTAILAAVAAGAASGTTEVGKQVLVDAYTGLKQALKRVFGESSEVVEAVKQLEQKPDSAGRKTTLAEEVKAAQAERQPEIIQAVHVLLEQLKAQPGGEQHIQTAIGSYIAQADRGGQASVTVGEKK